MSLIDLPTAKAHLRLESDYPDGQVEPYLNAAELLAAQFLNRRIYADGGAMAAAASGVQTALLAAGVAYQGALDDALAITDCVARKVLRESALGIYKDAQTEAREVLAGIVTNDLIEAGILLILGHLFENRQEYIVGTIVAKLPMGAHHLLQPFRVDMGV